MYNMLIDLLPTTIVVGGKEYPIKSDFRTSMLFEILMLDEDIEEKEKGDIAVKLYFEDIRFINDENAREVMEKILWFYTCGKSESEDECVERQEDEEESVENYQEERIYDFDIDDIYIYTAFLQQYGIDLQDIEYMHWWKFRAMFNSLNEDCKFSKILSYRSIDLSEIEDKKQREFYSKMKEVYKIHTKASREEQKKQELIKEMLLKGENPQDLL